MFDIMSKAVEDTATIHVKDAKGELMYADAERTLPVEIVVYGPGSKIYGVVEARQSQRVIKRMQENDGKITAAPHEERLKESAEDLAAITVRFNNFHYAPAAGADGVALFEAVYGEPKLGFIKNQVQKFINDWGNF